MAQKIVMYISVDLISAKEAEKEVFSSSISLPPSPNTRVNYLSDTSPPPSGGNHMSSIARQGAHTPVSGERNSSRSTTPISDRTQPHSRSRKNSKIHNIESDAETVIVASSLNTEMNTSIGGNMTDSQDSSKPVPVVTTNYIAWSTSNVTNTGPRHESFFSKGSKSYEQRVQNIEYTIQNGVSSLYLAQSWCARTQNIPNFIKFHPLEEQIAVAYKDKVMVNDRSSKKVQSYTPSYMTNTCRYSKSFKADVTSFEFVNPPNKTLLLVGYDDGCVRIWRPPNDGEEKPNFVTGWQAFNDVTLNRINNACGLVATYQTANNVVVTGSIGKHIRYWDVETEMKIVDIPTDTESAVRTLTSTNDGLTIAGFDDGCVRVIDKRSQPPYSIIRTYRDHTDRILECCLINEYGSMFSGCKSGECISIDFRANSIIDRWKTGREATAMAVYPYNNIVAIGSENTISLYNYNGQELNRTRASNDSYRGSRNVFISCLSFHPLKGSIATGYSDNLVTAYDINDKTTKTVSYYW